MVPLGRVQTVLGAVARGDPTQKVDVTSRDEVGEMAGSLIQATDSIRTSVQAMADNARRARHRGRGAVRGQRPAPTARSTRSVR